MSREDVLAGLTNDLVLQRLRRYLVDKGLPEGKYLLVQSELNLDGPERFGRLELTLPPENQRADSKKKFAGTVLVVITFTVGASLSSDLTLDINRTHPPVKRKGDLIYRFTGALRPLEEQAP